MPVFVGVDGCRGGWLLARAEDDLPTTFTLVQSFSEVVEATADAESILVDVPIGLTDSSSGRTCDRLARRILKERHVTVFTPPARRALEAETREEADALNRSVSSRGVGAQLFAIFPKLVQVDLVMRANPALQHRIREMHPEVAFAMLNGLRPVKSRKETPDGYRDRIMLLKHHESDTERLVLQAHASYRNGLEVDDVVDSMVSLVTTRLAVANGMPTIPSDPEVDSCGLRMEMVLPFEWKESAGSSIWPGLYPVSWLVYVALRLAKVWKPVLYENKSRLCRSDSAKGRSCRMRDLISAGIFASVIA